MSSVQFWPIRGQYLPGAEQSTQLLSPGKSSQVKKRNVSQNLQLVQHRVIHNNCPRVRALVIQYYCKTKYKPWSGPGSEWTWECFWRSPRHPCCRCHHNPRCQSRQFLHLLISSQWRPEEGIILQSEYDLWLVLNTDHVNCTCTSLWLVLCLYTVFWLVSPCHTSLWLAITNQVTLWLVISPQIAHDLKVQVKWPRYWHLIG